MMQNGHFTDVTLAGSHVGRLDLSSSKVSGKLNMYGVQVDRELLMVNRAKFADVDLTGAHLGELNLSGSKVSGTLNMVSKPV